MDVTLLDCTDYLHIPYFFSFFKLHLSFHVGKRRESKPHIHGFTADQSNVYTLGLLYNVSLLYIQHTEPLKTKVTVIWTCGVWSKHMCLVQSHES
jgi:hypothetical protein